MGRRLRTAALLLAAMTAGCAPIAYAPRPVDPEAALEEYAARSTAADGLKRFAVANGYAEADWPPREWGLRELTLAALYFHPDMEVARARAAAARAQLATAGARGPIGIAPQVEHHSIEQDEDDGLWSLGLRLEIPIASGDRRAAQRERSAFEADAADLDIAAAAWQVRARVRDRLGDLRAALQRAQVIESQVAARGEMLGMVKRRIEAGMLSANELAAEQLALSQAKLALADAQATVRDARLQLAVAVGLPADVLEKMQLRDGEAAAPPAADTAHARRLALRNRLDVHRMLLEFGAADADVKLAVAEQYPALTLGPGYAWDQGDNIWSLALGLQLPDGAVARARVRESEARRELAAQRFLATQAAAIASAEAAAARYRAALDRSAAATDQLELHRRQEARILRQFEAGSADRMQRVAARLAVLAAQEALFAAQKQTQQALAALEDAVQRPLSGDFESFPEPGALQRNAGLPDGMTRRGGQ